MSKDKRQSEKLAALEGSFRAGKLDEDKLSDFLSHYADVRMARVNEKAILSFYCEGMVDSLQLNEYYHLVNAHLWSRAKYLKDEGKVPPIDKISTVTDMIEKLFSGYLLYHKSGETHFYGVNIAKIPQRTPEESNTEVSIKGPKDAFTEEIQTNISLIRKRIKTPTLYNESFTLGSISQTKVSLLYLTDKVNHEVIKEVRDRLGSFRAESVLSAAQLEQWLANRTFSLFPLFDYITRPDFAIESMLRGRFIIIVDGSPMVLIGPVNLTELLKSPEDVHFPYYFVIFQRALRIIGITIAITLPGFWMAISSINLDQLPFSLLATLVVSRQGLPFPAALEAFFIMGLFELLREAGVRMPTAVGQTIAIVGGLIIGDAAIRAGISSPTIIVVIALTAVATYTLVNQSLSGTVTVLRLIILLISSLLGVYGFFISTFAVLIYLCELESFKLAYLDPIVSIKPKEILSALLINPFKRRDLTVPMLKKGRE